MEVIQQMLIDSVSGGFWRFVGYYLMTYIIIIPTLRAILILINRILRHWNIRKHGYPPIHCDADGDFKDNK